MSELTDSLLAMDDTGYPLSDTSRQQIDQWLKRYPADQRRSGVIQALMIVQTENGGWLTDCLIQAVAAYLGLPKIAAYEVATFYSMFNLSPVGRHVIDVCTNISCMLSGAEETVDYLKKKLGINVGETTADGRFTLRAVECLAACTDAPVCQIGEHYHERLTPDKLDALLDTLE